jgi:muramoyltetrapeptide carboxypeptidase LdcA involved in peptidoglycan recycling
MAVFPPKLSAGASVRVIAPSRSLAIVGPDVRAEADRKLAALGLEVSFGEHVGVCDDFGSAPVQDRLADLHAAFADPGVQGILTVLGGFNSNQLLAGIDYDLAAAIVGGNLCTFNLLQGTPFMPPLDGSVVFVEDDDQVRPWDFDRDLVSLLQQPGFTGVRAVIIGRFQKATGMTRELLRQIVAAKPELAGLPVIANVDFGHTTPMLTFPVGRTIEVRADPGNPQLTITRH